MASSVANYAQMECAICNESFKSPKVLMCAHIFCELCIHEWILKCKNKSLSGIECPLCRNITPPPKTGSDPTFWSSMLPEFLNEKEETAVLCQPCGFAKETKKAKFYCMECNEYLCVFCQISHSKLKVSKSHKTIEVEKAGDGNMSTYVDYSKLLMCKTHPEKEIEFLCEDDNDIFCSTCAFLSHRSCDEVLEIRNKYADKGSVKPLSAVSKWLQGMRSYVGEAAAIRRRYNAMFEENDEKMTVMLKEVKSTVIKGFEKVHGQIRREMKDKNQHSKRSNDERLNECERILQYIDTTNRTTREIMDMGIGGPEYAIVSWKMEERYNEIKDQITKLNGDEENFISHTFEFNQGFLKSLSQSETFGSFREDRYEYSFPKLKDFKLMKNRMFTMVKAVVSVPRARGNPYFTSACYILDDKDGRLVLADQTNKRMVILHNASSGKKPTEIKLSSKPYMIESMNKYVYVSFPSEKKIRKYDFREGFKQAAEIRTRMTCYAINGVSKCNDTRILVSLYDEENWKLVTYDSDGREVGNTDRDSDGDKFQSFWHFKVFDDTLYQSCQEENIVNAFKLKDDDYIREFSYDSDRLECPGGIDIDCDKNIYICGISSANIHIITQKGKLIKIIDLSEVRIPTNIAFSDNAEDVVVLGDANTPGPFLYCLT